jgi:hypothetical protein
VILDFKKRTKTDLSGADGLLESGRSLRVRSLNPEGIL